MLIESKSRKILPGLGPLLAPVVFAFIASCVSAAAQEGTAVLRRSDSQLRASATNKVDADQAEATRAGLSGVVGVKLVIGVDGNVETANAVTGPVPLRDAALAAARAWRWPPAVAGGLPARVSGILLFRFTADQPDNSRNSRGERPRRSNKDAKAPDPAPPASDAAFDYFNHGVDLENQGKFQEALGEFQNAITSNPSLRDAYLEIASIYGRLKRYDDQIQLCKQAMERFPGQGSHQCLGQIAAALGLKGKYGEAIEILKLVIQIKPDNPDSYLSLASFSFYAGHYNEAVTAATESARLRPINPMAYHDLGAAYARLGRPDDAIAAYNRALAFKPQYLGSAEVLIELADVYTSQKRWADALNVAAQAEQYLADAQQREPSPPTLFERLGDAYDKLKNKEKALSSWRKALPLSTEPEQTARINKKISSAAAR
jgi:tetratricopeptide (TPR) repeat protein